jgi:protein TonB
MTSLRRAALAALCSATLALPAAAGAAQARLNAYYQSAFTDSAWQQRAFAKVAKAWKQPTQAPPPGKKAVVQAVIDASGNLLSVFVSLESGSKQWDAAALAAVKKAAPFERLPAGYQLPTLEAHFHVSWE